MTSNITDRDRALRLGVLDCGLDLPVASANATFNRPGGPWLAAHILDGGSEPHTLGEGGQDLHTGILQIDINLPLLSGTEEASQLAARIMAYLVPGRVLRYGDTAVDVWGRLGTRDAEVAGYFRRSLSFKWSALIDR